MRGVSDRRRPKPVNIHELDSISLVTSSAATIHVYATFTDKAANVDTPGRQATQISSATTTEIVSAPRNATRSVESILIRNTHASTACDVTVSLTVGGTVVTVHKVTLSAGDALHYVSGIGFRTVDSYGREKMRSTGTNEAVVNQLNTVVLSGDVSNAEAVANTITSIPGLTFPVVTGQAYWFDFWIMYTAAATTTGSRFSLTGPATTFLTFGSEYSLAATTTTRNANNLTFDLPAASNATSSSTGSNMAHLWGMVIPSADGAITARFASEVTVSAITAKAGSFLQWIRTL